MISVILETVDTIKAIMADIRESGTDTHVATDESPPRWMPSSMAIAASVLLPHRATPRRMPHSCGHAAGSRHLLRLHPAPDACPDIGRNPGERGPGVEGAGTRRLERPAASAGPENSFGRNSLQAKAITERALDHALQKQEKQAKPSEEDATIRVETKRLDSVMNLVGELVLGRNRLDQDRDATRTEA